jgi:hypothetical protein
LVKNTGLVRFSSSLRNPIPLGNATGLQTRLHTVRHVGRDNGSERVNVLSIQPSAAAQRGGDDRLVEPEEGLRRLLHAWVFVAEARDEDGLLACWIEFGVCFFKKTKEEIC